MTSNLVGSGSGIAPIDPQSIRVSPISLAFPAPAAEPRAEAALRWLGAGFRVIPVVPGEKRTAITWDPWLERLSTDTVKGHWREHPEHDVGAILGDDLLVLDADSPAAIGAVEAIERRFDVTPSMVVRTRRGVHHYFRRAPGTIARSDSHGTAAHPERIDVKTGRALVVLPPSGGRELTTVAMSSVADLVEVGQDFIDAVFEHNGRPAPRPHEIAHVAPRIDTATESREAEIAALLGHLDPDLGYDDWLRVLMAVHFETEGSDSGLALVDAWSSRGEKYRGSHEVAQKWRSFQPDPITAYAMGTLMRMVETTGVDPLDVCASVGPQFESCDYVMIGEDGEARAPDQPRPTALDRFSLRGRAGDVERNAVDQVPLLGRVALLGQLTVFYAAPNIGKTLLVLHLLLEAMRSGRVDPGSVYYVNVDDHAQGLLDKLRIADECGFHMVADGYRDFSSGNFLDVLREMIAEDQARGVVVVLDTLKKFTDLMDKSRATAFMKVARQFVVKGGTIIGLAHTNKHPGAGGRPVFAGTTDVRDDADCVYTLQALDPSPGDTDRVVVFDNIKRRGNVAIEAAYRYSIEPGISYDELLASVQAFDQSELLTLKRTEAERSDADLIAHVQACVREGIDTKMRLADAVAERAGVSKRLAVRIIEAYTGADPARHRWQFVVRERGAKVFALLGEAGPGTEDRGTDLAGRGRDA